VKALVYIGLQSGVGRKISDSIESEKVCRVLSNFCQTSSPHHRRTHVQEPRQLSRKAKEILGAGGRAEEKVLGS